MLLGAEGGHLGQEFSGAPGGHFLPVEAVPEASAGRCTWPLCFVQYLGTFYDRGIHFFGSFVF